MSRVSNDLPVTSTNPAVRFLEWKAKEGYFSYYDKGAGENIKVELPIRFAFLEHYHAVRGWDDKSNSRLFSNEVLRIGQQELVVRSFGDGVIAQGLYTDIKPIIIGRGGKYHRSIYVMTEEGEIYNIQVKGAASAVWSDFYKENKSSIFDCWVEVTGTDEGKKGSIKWLEPVFEIGKKLTKKEDMMANAAGQQLATYFNEKFKPQPDEDEDVEVIDQEAEVDDIAF